MFFSQLGVGVLPKISRIIFVSNGVFRLFRGFKVIFKLFRLFSVAASINQSYHSQSRIFSFRKTPWDGGNEFYMQQDENDSIT